MSQWFSAGARILVLSAAAAIVASCGLPRSGPNKNEIFAGSVQRKGDAFVVAVNDRVIRATSVEPVIGFDNNFQGAGKISSDIIRPGDVLGITVWENVDVGLLAGVGQNATTLSEIQVDSSGHIFIPYAGRIKAAGNTPDQLRQLLTEKLDAQTPDPQVIVQRLAGDGAAVTLIGGVGAQGVYPIEGATRTLTAMLAKAGGVSVPTEAARIKVTRGSRSGMVWLEDLYADPKYDIALRPGDRILVEEDTRAFTALGATGTQTRVGFETKNINAVEAIAQVGGLSSALADPTGVFIFRDEPARLPTLSWGGTT